MVFGVGRRRDEPVRDAQAASSANGIFDTFFRLLEALGERLNGGLAGRGLCSMRRLFATFRSASAPGLLAQGAEWRRDPWSNQVAVDLLERWRRRCVGTPVWLMSLGLSSRRL